MISRSHLKELRELGRKRSRQEQGRFLVEGVRMAEEAAASGFEIEEVLFTRELEQDPAGRDVLAKLGRTRASFTAATEREIGQISDTVTAQGILLVVVARRHSLESLIGGKGPSLLVGFDGVSDPGNLGSVIRTCDWFGVQGVLIGRGSVELYNPKVVRSTMGGIFHLPIVEQVDLLSTLGAVREVGYSVCVGDAAGEAYAEELQTPERLLVILGNEAHGVSPALMKAADTRVAIRRYGQAESLNVGVACGVLLSQIRGK